MIEADRVWQALAHPARRRILDELRVRPVATGGVHEALSAASLSPSRFATQRHLAQLRDAGLVIATRSGREQVNALDASTLYQATIGWLEPRQAGLAASLDHLKRIAESPSRPTSRGSTMSELQHFTVRQHVDVAAPRDVVWAAFAERTSEWWGAPYLILDGASEIAIEQRVGGAVVERLGDAEALWGIVSHLEPGVELAWSGQMGMGALAHGECRFRFDDADGGTRVTVSHDSLGVFGDDMGAGYDWGWGDLNARLRLLVERDEQWGAAGRNETPDFEFEPSIGAPTTREA